MSRTDLLDAYMSGRISRRAFIRGLIAAGVSVSAATAYAAALQPGAKAGFFHHDFYFYIPPDWEDRFPENSLIRQIIDFLRRFFAGS